MTKKRLIIITSALVLFCCFGVVLITIITPESSETPTQALDTLTPEINPAKSLPTLTLAPTEIPTSTPIPEPTTIDTPVLADTPMPSPVPAETPSILSSEVQLYLAELNKHTQNISDALQGISELAGAADVFSDDWKIKMAVHMVTIRLTHEELIKMAVPADMVEIHEAVLDATTDCNQSTYDLAIGIDNFDFDSLEAATKLIQSCGEKIKIPAKMIEELSEQK